MPLRRTQQSDGLRRPRWKDGSHVLVESPHAHRSPSTVTAAEVDPETEGPIAELPSPRNGGGSQSISTRGRLDNAEADARIADSVAHGEVRLAILPYGRTKKGPVGLYITLIPGRCAKRQPELPMPICGRSCLNRRVRCACRSLGEDTGFVVSRGMVAWRARPQELAGFADSVREPQWS